MLYMIKLGIIAALTILAIMNNQGKIRTIRRMKNSMTITAALDIALLLMVLFFFK